MYLIPIIATILSLVLVSAIAPDDETLYVSLVVAVISSLWVMRLMDRRQQRQIDSLRAQLDEFRQTQARAEAETAPVAAEEKPAAVSTALDAEETEPPAPVAGIEAGSVEDEIAGEPAAAAQMPPAAASISVPARAPNVIDKFEDLIRRGGNVVASYFTDGNLFVRIGILILFFGVAFLLKYAAEHSAIPLEFRFMGAAAGGLALLVFGWRLRQKKEIYALLLQGGGIGVIYITIFAAFRLADLLPPVLTFGLLVFFSAFTVALALMQDSRALAVFAVLGGFLAPLLASTGSGNYVGLFSYYTVLNAGVFAVAWFRAWRSLNLLGFIFTFGVYALWVVFDYGNQDLYPGTAFLLLFFVMYSLIGVLYAMRQPEHLTGLVDGTLVFGTPVIVSGLLMMMLRDYDYGISGATAGLGVYYLLLARYAWRRVGEDFRLLAEAMLAIGVVFATLAIPYALEGHWSSAAWALEAAGILWVSIRQKRFYAQCFAILLQVGAGVLFLLRNVDDVGDSAWLNPAFLGGVFIALGAFISARMLYLQGRDFKLRLLHIPFYIWAMGWWLLSVLVQIDRYIRHDVIALLLLFGITASLLVYLDRIRRWNWMPASINAALLLPVLVPIALYSLLDNNYGHLLVAPDIYFWAAALIANYWIISRLEDVEWPAWINILSHVAFVGFVSLLLSFELMWAFQFYFDGRGHGFYALFGAMPLVSMWLAKQSRFPAIGRLGEGLQLGIIGSLAVFMILFSLLINLTNSGDPAPLPYVPFINPVDLMHIVFFTLIAGSLHLLGPALAPQRNHILIVLAGLIFVWLTAVLIRSMHHYLELRFDMSYMLGDTRVQTAISILWTVIGMGAMLFASRRALRPLWIIGAGLVAVVLIKMFFIDLGASGTVERIISFLVVGSLLVATGYFSPIPEREADDTAGKEQSSNV